MDLEIFGLEELLLRMRKETVKSELFYVICSVLYNVHFIVIKLKVLRTLHTFLGMDIPEQININLEKLL